MEECSSYTEELQEISGATREGICGAWMQTAVALTDSGSALWFSVVAFVIYWRGDVGGDGVRVCGCCELLLYG